MGLFRQLLGRRKPNECERCRTRRRVPTERYCRPCRAIMLQKMKDDGYLTEIPEDTRR